MAGQLARHVELLETVCRTGSYKEIRSCAKKTVSLLLRAASQDGIRDVAGSSSSASDQLMLKLFLGARVALERLLEGFHGKHLSQHEDMRCVNTLLAVCKVVLKAYISGKSPLLHEVAREQILKSGFLLSFAAICSAVAESLTWHAQVDSANDSTSSTSQQGQGSSSRVAAGCKSCKASGGEADTAVQLAEFSDDLMSLWAQLNLVICRVHHPQSRNKNDNSTQAWLLYDQAFVVTMAPVSALALAVLRFLSNYSYNSNSSGSPVPSLLLGACSISHYCCYSLDLEIKQAIQLNAWEGAQPHPTAAAVRQAMQSIECQELYLIEIAARLLQVQQKLYPGGKFSGSSKQKRSSKKQQQQQQTPALQPVIELNGPHTVLQLLGISGQVAQQFADMMSTYEFNGKDVPVTGDLCAALSNLERSIALSKKLPMINMDRVPDSSSSSICTDATVQLHTALVHMLCSALLMVPLQEAMQCCFACLEAVGSVQYACITQSSDNQQQAMIAAAATHNLIRTMITLGGPAVLQVLQKGSKTADETSLTVGTLTGALRQFLVNDWQIRAVGDRAPAAECHPAPFDWSAALQQHPLLVLATVEASARGAAIDNEIMWATMTMVREVAKAIAGNQKLLAVAATVGVSCEESSSSSSSSKGKDCSNSDNTLATSLVSCVISCLKFATNYIEGSYGNMAALQCAVELALLAEKVIATVVNASREDSAASSIASSSKRAGAAIITPWLHVLARALYCCSTALLSPHMNNTATDKQGWLGTVKHAKHGLARVSHQARMQQDGSSAPQDTLSAKQQFWAYSEAVGYQYFGSHREHHSWLELPCLFKDLFTAVTSCNRHLQQAMTDSFQDVDANAAPGLLKTAAENDQQYVQLDVGFEEAWEVCMSKVYSWAHHDSSTDPKPVSSWVMYLHAREALGYDISLQLQQYAAGVITLLPIRLCCNNPECSNVGAAKPLQQHMLSELACVGQRKCSRCEAAGYCSKQCQTEHWKQHKVICRRLCRDNKGKDQ